MAYAVRVYCDIAWIPEGVGGSGLGQFQANNPGYGTAQGAGAAPNGQCLRLEQAETVTSTVVNVPTAANITTAIQTAGTDIGTQITATLLAQIQGWKTGGP